jgi:hypothetical protein
MPQEPTNGPLHMAMPGHAAADGCLRRTARLCGDSQKASILPDDVGRAGRMERSCPTTRSREQCRGIGTSSGRSEP